ncbi:MAG: caspase family protein [Roseiflexus sp.]|nr:caspase family protein [Roseiflexus sp.]MDW8148637.1 caspase family protein [Roseiflexaceae bacterium]
MAYVLRSRLCPHRGYPEAQVTLLSNAGATRAGILAALTDLAARTTPDDTVLFFYSGHGEYSADGVYQLTTHDTRLAGRKVVAGTGISQPELLDKLRAIPARRLILLINACHAGEISPVLGESNQPFIGQQLPQQAADAILATGSGRIIITACRENQVAYIGPGPLTLFAQALTDGLRGQGLSGRAGYISVFDLYTHLYFAVGDAVAQRVSAELRRRYGETQEPELTVLKGVGPFPIALFRGVTAPGAFPTDHAPPEGVALRQVTPERSQWALEQSVSGARAVGIGGSVSESVIITGNRNTAIQSGRDTIQAGGDVIQTGGDYVGGDKISVGDVSGTGIAIGRGAQAHVQQSGGDHDAFVRAFAQIYAAITARPDDPHVDKEEIVETVKKIEQEAAKGEQANEHKLTRWLRNLAGMAEDIFEVTVAALTGPQAAFATVARKVAEKARQDSATRE